MTPWWSALLGLVGGFAVGSVNPAVLFARALGRDLRAQGSGNPGATNAGRVLGVRWGVLVGVLDVLKGLLPTLIVHHFWGHWATLGCGLGVVLGHAFSPFLKGRGGKGVATSLGAILAVAPWVGLAVVVVFAVLYGLVRVVGQASILVSGGLVVLGLVTGLGWWGALVRSEGWWLVLLGLLVLSRHRRNLLIWWHRQARGH